MSQWTQPLWEQTVKEVFRRALADEEFRRRCLADPEGVVREVSGMPLPEGKVRFVESLESQTLVLPRVWKGQMELSEIDIARIVDAAYLRQSVKPAL